METWGDVAQYIATEGRQKLTENFRLQRQLEDMMIERGIPLPPKSAILLEAENMLLGPRQSPATR